MAIWHITVTENVVVALLCSLEAACDGAVAVTCRDPQMSSNGQSVLVPLLCGVRREIEEVMLLKTIRGSSLDPFASVIAYSRSSGVDWPSI